MPNDTRTGLKISGNRSFGAINPPLSPELNFKQRKIVLTEIRRSLECPSSSLKNYCWKLLQEITKKLTSKLVRIILYLYSISIYICSCFYKTLHLFPVKIYKEMSGDSRLLHSTDSRLITSLLDHSCKHHSYVLLPLCLCIHACTCIHMCCWAAPPASQQLCFMCRRTAVDGCAVILLHRVRRSVTKRLTAGRVFLSC